MVVSSSAAAAIGASHLVLSSVLLGWVEEKSLVEVSQSQS
jgi:hypothetical protein